MELWCENDAMTIPLDDILRISSPSRYKLHLASRNPDGEQPLDVYVADPREWIGWNEWRGKRDDWNRPRVLSFLDFYPRRNAWLFGGCFEVVKRHKDRYELRGQSEFDQYTGRLIASFHRYQGMRGRAFRLERYLDQFEVDEILPTRYAGEAFPGYEHIEHAFGELEAVFACARADWKAALSSVKGVYLISDLLNGKKYVGSAYGDAGIWSRWSCYIGTGHGWNDELVRLMRKKGIKYARDHFRFSVLEVMTRATPDQYVLDREAHWKRALLTREHGYNLN